MWWAKTSKYIRTGSQKSRRDLCSRKESRMNMEWKFFFFSFTVSLPIKTFLSYSFQCIDVYFNPAQKVLLKPIPCRPVEFFPRVTLCLPVQFSISLTSINLVTIATSISENHPFLPMYFLKHCLSSFPYSFFFFYTEIKALQVHECMVVYGQSFQIYFHVT